MPTPAGETVKFKVGYKDDCSYVEKSLEVVDVGDKELPTVMDELRHLSNNPDDAVDDNEN